MIKSLHKIMFFLVISTSTYAETVEVFLNTDMKVTGVEEIKDAGHTVVYFYLDKIEVIEKELANKATQKYQNEIDSLVKKVGLKKLVGMTEFERNELFLKHLNDSGISVESLSKATVTANDREEVNKVLNELIYAEDNGVTKKMLPALIFKGRLYKNTENLSKVLGEE
ncbi:MAG: hypothetical protein L3J59_10350 [Methylococcaceae bacterium]|nr:hypothetical protein [Methylococcaceae bacterium]